MQFVDSKPLVIQFPTAKVSEFSWGANAATGRSAGSMRSQTGYFPSGTGFTVPFELQMAEGEVPYEPGIYLMPAGAVQASSKGSVFRPNQAPMRLVPLSEAISDLQALYKASSPVASVSPLKTANG